MVSWLKNNRERAIQIFGWVLIALALAGDVVIIFKGTWAMIHSDGATALILGREQWRQKKTYPDQWYYGREIWNYGLNTIVQPFMKLCRHWLDARACAVVMQTGIMVAIVYWFKREQILGRYWWLSALFMLLPVSEVVTEHFYFQATYMTAVLWLAVMMMVTLWGLEENKKKRYAGYVLLAAVVVIRGITGYSMVLVFCAPMMAALVLSAIASQKNKDSDHLEYTKRIVITLLVLAVSTLAGMAANSFYIQKLNVASSSTERFGFIEFTNLGNQILHLFNCFCRMFGAADTGGVELLTLSGVMKALGFAYLCFLLFFIPASLFKNRAKIKNPRHRFLLVFMIASSIATIYIFIFTGMEQARYLLWIYFYLILALGIWVYYFKSFSYSYDREIRAGVMILTVVMMVGSFCYYLSYDYEQNPERIGANDTVIYTKPDPDMIAWMKEKHYTYGYSGYWESYATTVYADGKVWISALTDDWKGPNYWLTSGMWYEPDAHKGKCFVMVPEDKYSSNLPEEYKKAAIKEEQYDSYHFLIYKDIRTLQRLWDQYAGS